MVEVLSNEGGRGEGERVTVGGEGVTIVLFLFPDSGFLFSVVFCFPCLTSCFFGFT